MAQMISNMLNFHISGEMMYVLAEIDNRRHISYALMAKECC